MPLGRHYIFKQELRGRASSCEVISVPLLPYPGTLSGQTSRLSVEWS